MVRLPPAAGPDPGSGLSRSDGGDRAARLLHVTGVVQGVGFRPFVHRLALRYGLAGWVRNASGEVEIAVEGPEGRLSAFLAAMQAEAPPLARIERIEATPGVISGRSDFAILASEEQADRRQPVPPDVALCAACEAELADPANRRYRYPFTTCTDCGPRYTVIQSLPYDRERTTMGVFTQCPECQREYQTPGDRRYHSETNSCPVCGPRLWFEPAGAGAPPEGDAALQAAVRLLRDGGILALRGFGGFHLACDATSPAAVALLRERKRRDAKPFAIMVDGVERVATLAELGPEESDLLRCQQRPVVLLRARAGSPLAPALAPGLDTVGVMLPSTPVHQLLLQAVGRPLVMTSGNLSEEPIAIGNDEARTRLGDIADGFLLHNRDILSRTDDSVLRVVAGSPVFLRRSRGFAPLPLRLPVASPVPLVAVGPHLKNTFTLVHGDSAWVSPHVGDLENLETLEHFGHALTLYRRLFRIEPGAVAHDLHPGYLSTRVARDLGVTPLLPVQHHHAHIAAVLAEHGLTGPAVGLAYDGTGYGDDGAVWGGEVLLADLTGYRRLAHLRYAPLPGGDLAARRPWRAALGYGLLDHGATALLAPGWQGIPAEEVALAERQVEAGVNAPRASSMGRLFDAAAAILGVRQVAVYEGQAAMELEALAGRRVAAEHPCRIESDGAGGWIVDPIPLLARLAHLGRRRQSVEDLAADFHASIAWVSAELVRRAVEASGVTTVVLGGGVFQNARLLSSVQCRLERRGLKVLVPRRLSPNDGGISYGQAAVAAARLAMGAPVSSGEGLCA